MAMTMLTGNADEADVMIEINTTPLIDVMLVLLIMLILTIPIQTNAVKLDMPTGAPPSQPRTPPVVQIDIAADGAIAWNGETLSSREQLETLARRRRRPRADRTAFAARQRRYRAVAMVMASRRLGANRIAARGQRAVHAVTAFITEPSCSTPTPTCSPWRLGSPSDSPAATPGFRFSRYS